MTDIIIIKNEFYVFLNNKIIEDRTLIIRIDQYMYSNFYKINIKIFYF